jgi:hypothetical protein
MSGEHSQRVNVPLPCEQHPGSVATTCPEATGGMNINGISEPHPPVIITRGVLAG